MRKVVLLILFAGFLSCQKTNERPNIVFIMTDDHAAHAISAYGSRLNQTPNIDRLAEAGVRFNNAFCTNAICAPSRAVILSGKYSHLNGVRDNRARFDSSQVTFPKLLQQVGYQTAMIGKWHLKSAPTGFDYWNVLPGQGHYYNPDFIEMGERKRVPGYVTDLIADFSIDWLEKRDKDKPFLLMYQHKAPHRNWMPSPEHLTMYDDTEFPLPPTFDDDYATRSAAAREQEMTVENHFYDDWDMKLNGPIGEGNLIGNAWGGVLERMDEQQRAAWQAAYNPKNAAFRAANLSGQALKEWKYQRYMQDYLATIASVDENIGRLLDYLDANGLAENTLIVYTSDQGFFLGDHGWFDKRFMYEEALRMPLIMRYPKAIAPGSVNEDIVLNLDFAPTFLDFAGVSAPEAMQGHSLRPLLADGKQADWRTSMYYHYFEFPAVHQVKRHYGVRTHDFKLIHFYNDIDAWELFDLRNDPYELKNVYDDPAYAETVQELKAELSKLRGQYRDNEG